MQGCTPLTEVLGGNTILVEAVQKAGLLDTLSGGSFTIFAPTDQAFTNLFGVVKASKDEALGYVDEVKKILKYHVVSGGLMAADLPDMVTTLQNDPSCPENTLDIMVS